MSKATEETWTIHQQVETDDIVVLRFGPQPGDWMSMSVKKDRTSLMSAAPELYRALKRLLGDRSLAAQEQALSAIKKAIPQ